MLRSTLCLSFILTTFLFASNAMAEVIVDVIFINQTEQAVTIKTADIQSGGCTVNPGQNCEQQIRMSPESPTMSRYSFDVTTDDRKGMIILTVKTGRDAESEPIHLKGIFPRLIKLNSLATTYGEATKDTGTINVLFKKR